MARPLLLPCLLVSLLVFVSTQQITFNTGSKACKVNEVSGTCKLLAECPVNEAHLGTSNVVALRAALTACGFRRPGPSTPMCCPSGQTGPRSPLLSATTFRNHPLCGSSPFEPGRIVGGEPVRNLYDFPWMAALKYDREPVYRCGGAIINERWVLTAGHCITGGGPVSVRTRDLDLGTPSDDNPEAPPVEVRVSNTFRHPDYRRVIRRPRGLFSDIALLKLEKDLVFSYLSKPLCLPEKKRSTADYERLSASYIAGWGLTEFGGETSPLMMWASVNVTNHRACQQSHARLDNSVDSNEHLCANGDDLDQEGCDPSTGNGCRGGVDACRGDSGGPLMMRLIDGNKRRWEAVGVISFGTGCGSPDLPGIYSRVDHFLGWIAETVASN